MATQSNTLAWKIAQTEEPGGLQFTIAKSPTQQSMRAYTEVLMQFKLSSLPLH